jgi:AraC-like DNA-binding protein
MKHPAGTVLDTRRWRLPAAKERITGSASERADMQDQWVNFVSRHVFSCKLSKSIPMEAGFQIDACSRSANGFTIARFATVAGKSQLVRGNSEIAGDERDRYVVYMSMRGDLELAQRGKAHTCRPSNLVLVSASEPMSNTKLGDNDTIDFLMPREFVDQRLVEGRNNCMRPIEAGDGLGHLIHHTLATFQHDAGCMSDVEFANATCLVGDLVLLALSGCSEVMTSQTSIRSANLTRIKAVVRARFADPGLTLGDIARECRLSLSYVHNLFRDDGRTLWEFLKSERLQRARQLLESPPSPDMTVTDVSLACGFANMSQFSTAFRRAFGMCPKDILRRR